MKKKLITLTIALFLLSAAGYYLYQNYFVLELQDLKIKNGTNVDSAIQSSESFLNELNTHYPQLTPFLSPDKPRSYAVPGLIRSKNIYAAGKKKGKIGYALDMTPQGLTVTKDYLIISAYSKSKTFHSVLWIINKSNRKFVKTIVLEGTDHVGGLAYDANHQRLWLTSTEKGWSHSVVAALSLADIKQYDFDKNQKTLPYEYKFDLAGIKRSSFMTLYQNKLFVGYFDKQKAGHLSYYNLDSEGLPLETDLDSYETSRAAKTISIPKKVQGIAFYKDKIIFSQSYGKTDSQFLIYKNPGLDKLNHLKEGETLLKVAAPPYLEQTWADGNRLYALFESSASAYRDNWNIVLVDRILKFDFSAILS
ncbi:hypothetical protein [Streptococcus pantholopis]|uniref:Uncharacterized protein n=1 Tax=Streptococcus pantholopis TaxID=1811193 RepID=A0A172Q6Z8_9STRE|nr:hypothetical protein [Streptococcus pantholopis]AND79238.1 hypothetical protein A0O21_03945 [Streptococcus pantholopis]